jgi:hypothetical protein
MAIFSLAQRTSGASSGTAALEVIAGTNAYSLKEIGMTLNAGTATTIGFGNPAAKGTTPTSVVALAEDKGNTTAATTTGALTWATGPTVPANFYRRVSLPATIGAGIVWTFPRGINQLTTVTTILWNFVTGSVMDVWFVVDE